MIKHHYVRLPMAHAYNIRDLGGYPCPGGHCTRWGTLLRADNLSRLDAAEIAFLKDYGLTCDIDLRSPQECGLQPDALRNAEGVDYRNIPLIPLAVTNDVGAFEGLKDMGSMYISVMESAHEQIREVMRAVINAPGGVLFHCSAGKDRTGVIAMLLLGLAGVARGDIIGNYETSYTYIRQNPDFKKYDNAQTHNTFLSKHQYIEAVLDHIDDTWGGIPRFLLGTGLAEAELEALRNKIVE